MTRDFAALTVSIFALVSCGGATGSDSANGRGTGGGGGMGAISVWGDTGGSGGTVESCVGYTPQATPADIAKTPRTDRAAELLAIETSGAFVAPDALYDRVSAELVQIAQAEPKVAEIRPLSSDLTASIIIAFDALGFQSYRSGTYKDWNCPNEAYGLTQIENLGTLPFVTLAFGATRYNTPLLANEYAGLPNVTSAEPDRLSGDGPDVCLEIQGDTHLYIFDQAGGDCPAGCTEHEYFGFELALGAGVKALGTFNPALPMPEPAWFAQLTDCRRRL